MHVHVDMQTAYTHACVFVCVAIVRACVYEALHMYMQCVCIFVCMCVCAVCIINGSHVQLPI